MPQRRHSTTIAPQSRSVCDTALTPADAQKAAIHMARAVSRHCVAAAVSAEGRAAPLTPVCRAPGRSHGHAPVGGALSGSTRIGGVATFVPQRPVLPCRSRRGRARAGATTPRHGTSQQTIPESTQGRKVHATKRGGGGGDPGSVDTAGRRGSGSARSKPVWIRNWRDPAAAWPVGETTRPVGPTGQSAPPLSVPRTRRRGTTRARPPRVQPARKNAAAAAASPHRRGWHVRLAHFRKAPARSAAEPPAGFQGLLAIVGRQFLHISMHAMS